MKKIYFCYNAFKSHLQQMHLQVGNVKYTDSLPFLTYNKFTITHFENI